MPKKDTEVSKHVLKQIFTDARFQLPIAFQSDDMKNEISALLSSYINVLEDNGVDDEIVTRLYKFKTSCSRMLTNYLKGVHNSAFYNFRKALENLQIEATSLVDCILTDEILYRGRVNEEIRDFSEDEMFHIPLNKRGLTDTQRFSYPGLPCIYAGASAYPCWVELNRPLFENLQMATLRPTSVATQKKVFDISHTPQNLNSIIDEPWFKSNEYILYWPLIAMCSIRVRNESDPFKPEYIFPQFLLQYILSSGKLREKYIGIKYASVKVASISNKQLAEDWHTYTCYAFPTQTASMKEKECEYLNEAFKIQKTRSGKELQVLSKIISIDKAKTKFEAADDELVIDPPDRNAVDWKIYTHDGKSYPYELSEFGMLEKAMNRDDFNFSPKIDIMAPISREEINQICDN